MNDNIQIDPGKVKNAAKKIEDNAVSYNKEIQAIYSTIDELKKAWQGSSAQRFTDDIESFREEFEKFGVQLKNYSDVLNSVAGDYQKLEDGDI